MATLEFDERRVEERPTKEVSQFLEAKIRGILLMAINARPPGEGAISARQWLFEAADRSIISTDSQTVVILPLPSPLSLSLSTPLAPRTCYFTGKDRRRAASRVRSANVLIKYELKTKFRGGY